MGQVLNLPHVLSIVNPSYRPIRLGFLHCQTIIGRLSQKPLHVFLSLHRGFWVGISAAPKPYWTALGTPWPPTSGGPGRERSAWRVYGTMRRYGRGAYAQISSEVSTEDCSVEDMGIRPLATRRGHLLQNQGRIL